MAKSAFGAVVPLIITIVLLAVVAVVGFVAYSIAMDVADNTSKRMEKKNVSFGKDGLKIGVKEVSAEQVGDSTQNVLMKTWNASSWPAYQSKLGWGQKGNSGSPASTPSSEKRKPFFRSSAAK